MSEEQSRSEEEEAEYVLRDLMTPADVEHNIARLRAEAMAMQRHADALEAWGKERFGTALDQDVGENEATG